MCVIACEEPDADLVSAWLDDDFASSRTDNVVELSPSEVQAALSSTTTSRPVLVDLRTRAQHSRDRPSGAVSIPAGDPGTLGLLFRFGEHFVADVAALCPPEQPLVLLCDVGVISRIAAMRLRAAGHASVAIVSGGFEGWCLEESLPTVHGRPADAAWSNEEETPPPIDWSASVNLDAQLGAKYAAVEEDEEAGKPFLLEVTEEIEVWPPSADGTRSPLQPRFMGAVQQDEEPVDDFHDLHAVDDDDDLGLGDLETLLGDDEPIGATDFPPTETAPTEAPTTVSLPPDAHGATTSQPAAQQPPQPQPPLDEEELQMPDLNALAGDDLDESLAEMVATLDAPVRPPTGSGLPATLATRNGAKPSPSPSTPSKLAGASSEGKKRKRRSKVGAVKPSWLVDVSAVDFAQMAAEGRLAKLSVKELKSFLYARDEILTGNKKELTERVTNCLDADGGNGSAGGSSGGGSSGGGGGAGGGGGGMASVRMHMSGTSAPIGTAAASADGDGIGDESAELAGLSSLPAPSADEDAPLSMFNPDTSPLDAQDAFLIDEVFSAM